VITYFLHNPASGLVKIGRTTRRDKRVRDLANANGIDLAILGTLDGDLERAWQERFQSDRARGEWFRVSPGLAAALRNQFGCRLRSPRERPPRRHRLTRADFIAEVEALSGLGLRDPDLEALGDYLYQAFPPETCDAATENDGDGADFADELEDPAEALEPILSIIEQWGSLWLGWMAPANPRPEDGWLDVWLVFWKPAGEESTRRLRFDLLRAADYSDDDPIEQLRLRPILIDRHTGALDVLPPEELYSDGALLLISQSKFRLVGASR
jgi:hypothetical protein